MFDWLKGLWDSYRAADRRFWASYGKVVAVGAGISIPFFFVNWGEGNFLIPEQPDVLMRLASLTGDPLSASILVLVMQVATWVLMAPLITALSLMVGRPRLYESLWAARGPLLASAIGALLWGGLSSTLPYLGQRPVYTRICMALWESEVGASSHLIDVDCSRWRCTENSLVGNARGLGFESFPERRIPFVVVEHVPRKVKGEAFRKMLEREDMRKDLVWEKVDFKGHEAYRWQTRFHRCPIRKIDVHQAMCVIMGRQDDLYVYAGLPPTKKTLAAPDPRKAPDVERCNRLVKEVLDRFLADFEVARSF